MQLILGHHAAHQADKANRDTLMQLPSSISFGPQKVMDAISRVIKVGTKVLSQAPPNCCPWTDVGTIKKSMKSGAIHHPGDCRKPSKHGPKQSNLVSFTQHQTT